MYFRAWTRVSVTLTCLDESLRAIWEPRASSVEDRCRVLRAAQEAGIETGVMFGPLLPFLSDHQEYVDRLIERAADLNVGVIWVDALNPRPKVWESLRAVLSRSYPDLLERYRAVLFAPRVREAYGAALRERVMRAAKRFHVAERVAGCA